MKNKLKTYITLLRPYQWIKNLLLFSPLFFSGKIVDSSILNVMNAAVLFCLLSSLGYILNDWVDRKRDKLHDEKKNRPICSGSVSGRQAIYLSCLLIFLMTLIIFNTSFTIKFLLIVACYFTLTVSYSLYIKNVVLLELFVVAMGFVIRVTAGGAACLIDISSWLFLTVFFISMLISVAKRLSEYSILGKETAILHRSSQAYYGADFLTNLLWACGAITLVVYSLYVVEKDQILIYSLLPATYGVLRFIMLTEKGRCSDPIKVLLKDKQLALTTIVFLFFLIISIYKIDLLLLNS